MRASNSSAGLHIGIGLGNDFDRERCAAGLLLWCDMQFRDGANNPHLIVNVESLAQAGLPRAEQPAPRLPSTRPT